MTLQTRLCCIGIVQCFQRPLLSGEVASWNFESWNEPDHGDFGTTLGNVTLNGFLNYYDATTAGISDAAAAGGGGKGRRLRLGGPGGSCRSPKFIRFCHGLIDHCAGYELSKILTGTNAIYLIMTCLR